jgi:hypothetical chaperone protein
MGEARIDRVLLTGGSSLIAAVRDIFLRRFGEDRTGSGGELTSIAHGLAMVAQEDDIGAWESCGGQVCWHGVFHPIVVTLNLVQGPGW